MKKKDLSQLYTVKPSNPDDPEGIRQYFRNIINAMPNNVYWLNRHCITLGCNSNTLRLIGLKRLEDFVGITYEEMGKLANWTEGQAESFKRDDMEVMTSGKPKYNVEEPPLYDDQGNPVYYMSSRVPLFDENNNVIGVVGISVDITHRKQLEEKLRKTEASEARFKAMSALGGMIAHELRTPLTGLGMSAVAMQQLLPQLIEGYEKSVNDGKVSPIRKDRLEALKKSINNMSRSVKYAQATITTILTGFRSGDTDTKVEILPFSLKEAVTNAVSDYPFDIGEENLCTIKHIDNLAVRGDELILAHVLHNLLKNALHAINAESKGKITIWSELSASHINLYVEDTAKGIAPEHLEHIFEAFFTTKKETAASIGLGLYFCKMALRKMGAQISCESELGKYTRFKITLLLAKNLDYN